MAQRKNSTQRIDRRRFLVGAGGAMLALPMLEAHAPRVAYGQTVAPPKRLVVVMHQHGRNVGNGLKDKAGAMNEAWSPLAKTGAYPATGTLSQLLAALGDVRKEIVTIDGVDNLVRHLSNDTDGHLSSIRTCATCVPIKADKTGGGPSIDYVAGLRLRASAAQRLALVFPAGPYADEWRYEGNHFYGAGGTKPAVVNSNPATALLDLFGAATGTEPPPPKKTLHDRLLARRPSMLDSVAKSYEALRTKVSASDRDRLDQHAAFIRTLETRLAGGGPISTAEGCGRPDEKAIPTYAKEDTTRGNIDGKITPYQIENLVMSLACDVTRTATLHFDKGYDFTFQSEFTGDSPLGGANNWHGMVHGADQLASAPVPSLVTANQYFGKMFALLINRLAAVQDTDGSRLLDNTLVVWVSDMGYGSLHYNWNIPVVMAGMKSAFANGQGRHLVSPRRSLGDLYAQVLRMLGGTDTSFGTTGTIGSNLTSFGLSGPVEKQTAFDTNYITNALNLHLGALDL
jgi:hypothetical protein